MRCSRPSSAGNATRSAPHSTTTRYAAIYAFFLESLDAASERLKNFVEKAAKATLVGDVFDDAATGQGLLNYFLRAINCGALSEDDVVALNVPTGVPLLYELDADMRPVLPGGRYLDPEAAAAAITAVANQGR